MSKSVYLINPSTDFPTYFSADHYAARGLAPATQVADLAITTLGAMAPPDFEVRLCDENISAVDLDSTADFVGITGKITQFARMVKIAAAFRKRGTPVIIGGPYASLVPELVRPHCDILVRGEIEEIAAQIFADLRSGTYQDEYVGGQPSLENSPVPFWSAYANDRAMLGSLQTSRGCPFECEFCDVIQYAGRKQRHKDPAQVIRELDCLYSHGYRNIFLADDNFTAYRARARELLLALRTWNRAQEHGKVAFMTQLSIDAAKDTELLNLCSEAGLVTAFIGIETPNPDSLREAKKKQNLRANLVDQVHEFMDHGIQVVGGMIVGFDSDGHDIFERQYDFAMASGIPIFTLGALVAPAATPLHARVKREGRLKEGGNEVIGTPWTTNIVHPNLSQTELVDGLRWLANSLYNPELMTERLLTFIGKLGSRRDPKRGEPMRVDRMRSIDRDTMSILDMVRRMGPQEERMWSRVMRAAAKKPDATGFVLAALIQYMQIRYMYDLGQFWDAQPGPKPAVVQQGARSLPVLA